MSVFRRSRFIFWAIRELSFKYTQSLLVGVILGFILMTVLYSVFPFISQLTIGKVERIGLIGEYTPSNLPLAIQEKISFGLVKSSPNGSVEPKLALSWETTDSGKQYTFHLADTYTWHS